MFPFLKRIDEAKCDAHASTRKNQTTTQPGVVFKEKSYM